MRVVTTEIDKVQEIRENRDPWGGKLAKVPEGMNEIGRCPRRNEAGAIKNFMSK